MAFSSGTFTLAAGNPVTTLTTISSSWANTTFSDIATGLSSCMLKDGTQTMTANLPMAGFKLTGIGAGANAGESLRYEQLFTTGTVSLLGALFVTNTISTTGALNTPKAATITATATVALGSMTGNYAVITGTNTITSFDATAAGVLRVVEFSGAAPVTHNATSMILPNATSIVMQAGQCALVVSENSGSWRWLSLTPSKQPTRQVLTSGTAATYTTPIGCTRINVRANGPGGGGAGSGTGGTGSAATTFSGSSMSAGPGVGGQIGGLTASAAATATGGDINISGATGSAAASAIANVYGAAGAGANSVFGGAGAAGAGGVGPTAGLGAATNSGSGGGGGAAVSGSGGGGGGNAGAYCEKLITAPATTYTYTIGTGGTAGASNASVAAGGVGAAGIIIVDEYYD